MQLQRQFADLEGALQPFQGLPSLPAKVASQHAAKRTSQLKLLQLKGIPCSPTPVPLTLSLCFLLSERQALQIHGALNVPCAIAKHGYYSNRPRQETVSYCISTLKRAEFQHCQTHHTRCAMQAVFVLDVPAAQPDQVSAQGTLETSSAAHCKPSNDDENEGASMKAPTAAESAGPVAGQAHPDKATWSIERPAGLQEVVRWCGAQQMWPLLQGQLQASTASAPNLAWLVEGEETATDNAPELYYHGG